MSKVRHIIVSEADDGQRLDRWLKKHLGGTPFGLIQKIVRKGQVRVDGKRAKGDTRLSTGQDIRIPPLETREEKERRPLTPEDKAYIQSLVLYDDGDVVVISKPYGLPTQGGKNIFRHVDFYLDGLKNKKGLAPRLVHRLDKDTSGALLLARSATAVRELGKSFKGRKIRKYYWAICVPTPEMLDGEIHAAISDGTGNMKDRMVIDPENGKRASTLFEVVEFAAKKAAFVIFWPRTGRKHQIRVHAQKLGSPIIGDTKYVRNIDHPEQDIKVLEEMGLENRLHLHAQRLVFAHPITGKMVDVQAPLTPDLRKSWKALGFTSKYKDDPFSDISLS